MTPSEFEDLALEVAYMATVSVLFTARNRSVMFHGGAKDERQAVMLLKLKL